MKKVLIMILAIAVCANLTSCVNNGGIDVSNISSEISPTASIVTSPAPTPTPNYFDEGEVDYITTKDFVSAGDVFEYHELDIQSAVFEEFDEVVTDFILFDDRGVLVCGLLPERSYYFFKIV